MLSPNVNKVNIWCWRIDIAKMTCSLQSSKFNFFCSHNIKEWQSLVGRKLFEIEKKNNTNHKRKSDKHSYKSSEIGQNTNNQQSYLSERIFLWLCSYFIFTMTPKIVSTYFTVYCLAECITHKYNMKRMLWVESRLH